jgi:hypothetical protein
MLIHTLVNLNVEPNFLVSFQIYEGLASSGEPAEKSRLKGLALISYRRSVELDLSQTDLLLKIGELMLNLPIEEHGKARSDLPLVFYDSS